MPLARDTGVGAGVGTGADTGAVGCIVMAKTVPQAGPGRYDPS